MIIDFETIDNDSVFDADLCIVGAGASGITMALEFANSVKRVILVESGSFGVNDAYESLNAGEVDGLAFVGLQGGRRRGLGGTTAAWGGQCCELDAADFSERAWLPDSGWPFPRAQLEPFYRRAECVFNVSGERYDESNWRRFGLTPVPLGHEFLNTSFSVFSPHPRLGPFYRKALVAARNLHVVLGATVTNIRTNAACTSVEGVEVRSASGRRASVRARVIVLCTGTIESARLLLASRDVAPGGIGNDCDLVGRYLQDHPTADTATITGSDTRHLQEIYGLLYRGRTWYWPKLALAPALASRARALNASAFVMFEYDSPALEILRDIVRTTRTGGRLQLSASRLATLVAGTSSVLHAGYRRYLRGRSPQARPSKINLTCTIEQAPNRYSRVMLSSKRDTLGVPLPLVDWRLTEMEHRTFRLITQTVAGEFARLGLGTVSAQPWLERPDELPWPVWDNYHQTGTTRMAEHAASGVVDPNCQVHGVAGLFVAGAPTFPTSGYANPVLTIAAMTIRLSDHLKTAILH